ncbi:MAG: hypothetical protein HZC40_16625 [Chloroflexi bacterium]|nr:hypothetical protein [Chloroflexota bacterium]
MIQFLPDNLLRRLRAMFAFVCIASGVAFLNVACAPRDSQIDPSPTEIAPVPTKIAFAVPTDTPTPTRTPTATRTSTFTPTATRTRTRTATPKPTATAMPTRASNAPVAALAAPSPTLVSIPGESYRTLRVFSAPVNRPAATHPDFNLAVRGFAPTQGTLKLVDIDGPADPAAPQLATFFSDNRTATFSALYQIYEWNWECNCRGALITDPDATMAGLVANPGETLHVPVSGYNIGEGMEVLVLYADAERITLKYSREDSVTGGYTFYIEGIAVEANLLALYQQANSAGRGELPALREGQAFARARENQVKVVTRDGAFFDPRSRKDWWRRP